MARAAVPPAKPPPITTTRGARWAKAGAASPAADTAAPIAARACRRLTLLLAMALPPRSFLGSEPIGDGLNFRLGKAFGDPAHHRARFLPAFEGLHLACKLRRTAPCEPRNGCVGGGAERMTAGTGAGTRRRLGGGRAGHDEIGGDGEEEKSTHARAQTIGKKEQTVKRPLLVRSHYTSEIFSFFKGSVRMRLPVAAK